LDKTSLAYIYFESELTPKGLKEFSTDITVGRTAKMLKKTISYVKLNDKWHFKHSKKTEYFTRGKSNTWIKDDEYLTTKIQVDSVHPIPLTERIEYGDIFSEKAKNYQSEDYWGEYNVLKKDSSLDKQLKLLYDTAQTKALLSQKTRYKKKGNLIKIISKLAIAYGISYYPVSSNEALFQVNYADNNKLISFEERTGPFDYNLGLYANVRYDLNHQWSMNLIVNNSISKKILTESYRIGPSYRILLNKKGKPVFLNLVLLFSYNTFAGNFSNYNNTTDFEFAGKKIDADKLQFGIGYNTFDLTPQVSLEFKLKRRLYLQITSGYHIPLYSKEKLFLKEKSGFFLTRKKGDISLSDNSLNVTYNGEPTTKSHLTFDNYTISLGFMIKF
jgi:hypothetical protein